MMSLLISEGTVRIYLTFIRRLFRGLIFMDFEFGFGESGDYLGWAGNGIWIGDFEDCFSR